MHCSVEDATFWSDRCSVAQTYPQQQDGMNCGIHAIWQMYLMSTDTHYEEKRVLRTGIYDKVRSFVYACIKQGYIQDPNCTCPHCGEWYGRKFEEFSVQCDQCQKWVHIQCLPHAKPKYKMTRKTFREMYTDITSFICDSCKHHQDTAKIYTSSQRSI